jgi:hypothetical protein
VDLLRCCMRMGKTRKVMRHCPDEQQGDNAVSTSCSSSSIVAEPGQVRQAYIWVDYWVG